MDQPSRPQGVCGAGWGAGESFLMDGSSVVPVVRKTHLHFHEFMRAVHRHLDELQTPLLEVARRHRQDPADLLRRIPRSAITERDNLLPRTVSGARVARGGVELRSDNCTHSDRMLPTSRCSRTSWT
ncbi:hypothetical protein [Massilia phosphatilytica]